MKKIGIIAALCLPLVSFAALDGIGELVRAVGEIVRLLLPIVFSLALLAFFWGVAKFVFNSADEGKREEGKKMLLWGVIGMFVIATIWGIVFFIGDQILGSQYTDSDKITVPTITPQ